MMKLQTDKPRVYIRTFGYFDVFVDGNPVFFTNAKAKELLALLVEHQGSYLSSSKAIEILWEGEPVDERLQARYRRVCFLLKKTLREAGVEEIVEVKGHRRRIVTGKVRCDFYDYLEGKINPLPRILSTYMSNYDWNDWTFAAMSI